MVIKISLECLRSTSWCLKVCGGRITTIKNVGCDYKLPIFSNLSHTTTASRGIETSSPTTTVSVRRQTNVTYTPTLQQTAFSETQSATVKAPSEETVSEFQPLVPYNFTEANSTTEDPFKQFNSLYPSESPKKPRPVPAPSRRLRKRWLLLTVKVLRGLPRTTRKR